MTFATEAPLKCAQITGEQSAACATLVAQFVLCLPPQSLYHLRVDLTVNRIDEVTGVHYNVIRIHTIIYLVKISVSSPCISDNDRSNNTSSCPAWFSTFMMFKDFHTAQRCSIIWDRRSEDYRRVMSPLHTVPADSYLFYYHFNYHWSVWMLFVQWVLNISRVQFNQRMSLTWTPTHKTT